LEEITISSPSLRITKWMGNIPVEGGCTSCADVNLKVQATTHRPALEEYRTALAAAFELHFKHVHMRDDASQTAARIVREATENR
jgi:hypothetical protein